MKVSGTQAPNRRTCLRRSIPIEFDKYIISPPPLLRYTNRKVHENVGVYKFTYCIGLLIQFRNRGNIRSEFGLSFPEIPAHSSAHIEWSQLP